MISANIRKLRRKNGVSQDKLSKLSNLSLNTIVKIEAGRNPNPTIKTLSRIASSLNVKIDDLLIVIVLALFSLGSLSGFAYAQGEGQAAQAVLSLQDAVNIAYRNNKDILIQQQEVVAAGAYITGARSEFLPHLNVGAGYTHNGAVTPVQVQGKKDLREYLSVMRMTIH